MRQKLLLAILMFPTFLMAQMLNVEGGAEIDGNTFTVDEVHNRVGIGTNDPQGPLSLLVNGGESQVGITQNNFGGTKAMEMTTEDDDGDQATRILLRGGSDSSDIQFCRGGRLAESVMVHIDGRDGYLGILTETPEQALHVNGGMKVDEHTFNVIESNNRVGIGTDAPSRTLEVVGSVKVDGMTFNVKQSNDRVGIGTDSPIATLEVVGDTKIDGNTFYVDDIDNRVGVGTSDPLHELHVDGRQLIQDSRPRLHMATYDGDGITLEYNETDIDFRIQFREDNGNNFVKTLMTMDTSGNLYFKGLPFGDYTNVQYDKQDGKFYHDTSSKRFKRNIENFDTDFYKIMEAQPKKYTRPGKPDRWEIGYIAEEMLDIGLDALVGLDEQGIPSDFNYTKMVLYLNEVNKIQENNIIELKNIINNLVERIENLEQRN